MHRTFVLLAAALLLACVDSGRELVVRVSIPGPDSVESPVPQTLVMALPYDRDSLRDALAAAAGAERPRAAEAELDSLFALFREPFTAFVTASSAAERLADSLPTTGDPGLRARLVEARAAQRRAQARLDEVRAAIGGRVDTLRAEVQQWEHSAFQNWSAEVEQLGRRRREPFADTTGARGTATLRIPGGAWWIHATAHDPIDPNSRWYWNVPVPPDADTLELNARTGTRRARY